MGDWYRWVYKRTSGTFTKTNYSVSQRFIKGRKVRILRSMSYSLTVLEIGPKDRRLLEDFVQVPHTIYRDSPYWVPRLRRDVREIVEKRHPFFEHSDGASFVAYRDGRPVGRVAVFENRASNTQNSRCRAHFYFLDMEDDPEITRALLDQAAEWGKRRGLNELEGPMLFGGPSGSGILIDGFEHRAAMTMMLYNHPYYRTHLETLGFRKLVDFISYALKPPTFSMPEKVERLAKAVLRRGRFEVIRFSSKRELEKEAEKLAPLFNETLGENLENYRFSDAELDRLVSDLLSVADPKLIKILTYDGNYAGYLLTFPDLSGALRRSDGRLTLRSIIDIKREFRRTRQLIINGAGILPEYQRLGGNALLYYELMLTAGGARFEHADLTQIGETTALMLADVETLGARRYKKHRVYIREM